MGLSDKQSVDRNSFKPFHSNTREDMLCFVLWLASKEWLMIK